MTNTSSITPLKAIKAHCKECCGDTPARLCTCTRCNLYPLRLGKNTMLTKRVISEERKEELLKNIQKRWRS